MKLKFFVAQQIRWARNGSNKIKVIPTATNQELRTVKVLWARFQISWCLMRDLLGEFIVELCENWAPGDFHDFLFPYLLFYEAFLWFHEPLCLLRRSEARDVCKTHASRQKSAENLSGCQNCLAFRNFLEVLITLHSILVFLTINCKSVSPSFCAWYREKPSAHCRRDLLVVPFRDSVPLWVVNVLSSLNFSINRNKPSALSAFLLLRKESTVGTMAQLQIAYKIQLNRVKKTRTRA